MHQPSKDEAIKIIEELPIEKSFYFYTGIGSPTGKFARSLGEFIGMMKIIEMSSVEFHVQRGDFINWIKMLGDETLSQQIAKIEKDNLTGEKLRQRLLQVLRMRYGTLRKISMG